MISKVGADGGLLNLYQQVAIECGIMLEARKSHFLHPQSIKAPYQLRRTLLSDFWFPRNPTAFV